MKILYKDGVKTICKDSHPDVEGWEVLMLPDGHPIVEMVETLDGQVETVKSITRLRSELEALNA